MNFHVNRQGLTALLITAILVLVPLWAGAASQSPQFSLPAVNQDKDVSLADYRGQVVLINFWATWCPPCREEIPSLMALQKEFGADQFTVLGLSMDQGGKRVVSRFADKLEINYPLALANDQVARQFGGVIGIPTSFLIGRDGTIVKHYPGFVPHAVLQKDVAALVAVE